MNINCIICSDLISQTENIYFTRCGHVFHYHCLAQWIERSKSCPQCRNKVTEKCISRVYFNFANGEGIVEDATALQAKLDNVNFQLRQKETENREKQEKIKTLEGKLKVNEEILKGTEKKLVIKETAILALKDQLEYCKVQNLETERLRSENEKYEKTLNTLNGLQKVLNATADEVDLMLKNYTDVEILANFASALKRALMQAEAKKNDTRSKLQAMKTDLSSEKNLVAKLQGTIRQLQEKLTVAEQTADQLLMKRKIADVNESLDDTVDSAPTKIRKSDNFLDIHDVNASTSNTAKPNDSFNMSIHTLVKRIEDADSPYLQLKQGGGSRLTTLRIRNTLQPHSVQPSEIAVLKPSKSIPLTLSSSKAGLSSGKLGSQDKSLSIFSNKLLNQSLDMFMDDMEAARGRLETSYDGLGGHSKPDFFPVPVKKSPIKSCVPKVTAKHRLKNPNKTMSLERFFDKIGPNR